MFKILIGISVSIASGLFITQIAAFSNTSRLGFIVITVAPVKSLSIPHTLAK
ncbi:hypothetical protein [Phormidesmis priestleyi]|uniref:hypothetical protein n=1 Tax=Phormidesmis priestleyi TaxID=268141 RepID=UPI0015E73D6D|nr:hypothetical protein [Phormidesmis priestleyi]